VGEGREPHRVRPRHSASSSKPHGQPRLEGADAAFERLRLRIQPGITMESCCAFYLYAVTLMFGAGELARANP